MNKLIYAVFMLGLISVLGINCTKAGDTAEYDTVVQYEKGKQIKFTDFNLEFIEERTEKKEFPNGTSITFRFFDFKISNDKETKTISWSAGTGDIAPADFEFDGKKYQIEMSKSEKLNKRLNKNEIVIVKK